VTPRDIELELAQHLDSAALGVSTIGNPPTLYAGHFPVTGPDRLLCVRHTGGDKDEYLGGGGLLAPDLQVVVRGNREEYSATRELAVAAWAALHQTRLPGIVDVRCEGAGPVYQGPDANGRPRFSFTCTARYTA
jgi:hypothetical protein